MMRTPNQHDDTSLLLDAQPSVRPLSHLFTICRRLAQLALFVVAAGLGQSEWQVDVLIPDTISVRMPTQEIAFGLTHATYPPPSFPARYAGTLPEGGVVPIEVFSSASGGWSLLLEIPDLTSTTGRGLIPADQVLFRVNDGVWTRGSPLPQVVFTSLGPTGDWHALEIEFQLELVGSEPPGSYEATTRLTALRDGGGP